MSRPRTLGCSTWWSSDLLGLAGAGSLAVSSARERLSLEFRVGGLSLSTKEWLFVV